MFKNFKKGFAIIIVLLLMLPASTVQAAITGTFTATQTVANVVAGTNDQAATTVITQANVTSSTLPTPGFSGGVDLVTSTLTAPSFGGGVDLVTSTLTAPSFSGGVDEVKAVRTLVVNSLPTAADDITIGLCVVTFSDAGDDTDEVDCTDDVAGVSRHTATGAPGTPRTAAQIAVVLQSLTNVSDTNHGALTVGAPDGTHVSFTTAGTEIHASSIAFTDGTSGSDITSSGDTAGIIPVAATATLTVSDALAVSAADQSIEIDDVVIALGALALTNQQVSDAIAGATYTTGTSYQSGAGAYTVANGSGLTVTFTRSATGTAGNAGLTMDDTDYTNVNGVAATATLTVSDALAVSAADQSIEIDDVVIALGALALTNQQVSDAIAGATYTTGTSYQSGAGAYTVANGSGLTVTFTRSATGTAGNAGLTMDDTDYTNVNGVAATATSLVPSGIVANAGDQTLNVDGVGIALGNLVLTDQGVSDKIVAVNFSGGASYNGAGGSYTVTNGGGASTTVTFTRDATGVAGNTGLSVADAAYGATAQVNTITITGTVDTDDTFTASLPGAVDATYTVTGGDTTTTNIATGLDGAITASAGYAGQAFTSSPSANTVALTAKVAGTGFTQTSSETNRAAVAQEVTFTPASVTLGETYRGTINGTDYDYSVSGGDDVAAVVAAIAPLMNAHAAVGCVDTGSTTVTCTASTPGTSFTYAATVVDITPPDVISIILDDTDLNIGDNAGVTITFTEPVINFDNTDITTIDNGGLSAVSSSDGGVTWTATFTPNAGVEDTSNVIVITETGIDDTNSNAGVGTTSSGNYTIDTIAPTLPTVTIASDNAKDTTLAKAGDTVMITITSSETLGAAPTVAFWSGAVAVANATIPGGGGTSWTAAYVVDPTDTDGAVTFTIDFADVATNSGIQVTAVTGGSGVTVDVTAPTVTAGNLVADESACTGAGGTICKVADVITFTWDNSADGNTDEDPAAVIADLSSFGGSAPQLLYDDGTNGDAGADNIYTYALTIPSQDDDGLTNTFDVTVDDLAGNSTGPITSTDTAPVDNIEPTHTGGSTFTLQTDNNAIGVAEINDTFDYNADGSEGTGDTVTWSVDISAVTANGADTAATSVGNPWTVGSGAINNPVWTATETITDDAGNTVTGSTQAFDVNNVAPTALTLTDVEPLDKAVSASGFVQIYLTATSGILKNEIIEVVFPTGFDVSVANAYANESGMNGTFVVTNDTVDTVLITRQNDGIDVPPGTAVTIQIGPITNPNTAIITGPYTLRTRTTTSAIIDEDTNVPGDQIGGGGGLVACNDGVDNDGDGLIDMADPGCSSTTDTDESDGGGVTGGGGGGGGVPTNSDSNTTTSTLASNVTTVNADQTYSRPIQFVEEVMIIDTDSNIVTVQATGDSGTLTIKPNSQSTIFLEIPSDTTITADASWSGRIEPPLIRSLTNIHSSGEAIEGTDDLLMRNDVAVLVEVGDGESLNFSNDVTLTIPVDLPDGSVVNVYSSTNGDTWTSQGTAVVQNGQIIIMTDHLSYYALEMTDETAELVDALAEAEALALAFDDIAGHWAESYIDYIADLGIVSGKTETTFAPNDNITRAELTKIVMKAFNYSVAPTVGITGFGDVSTAAWYAPYIVAARNAGIVQGYEGNIFSPNGLVNRAEALKILIGAAGFVGVEENYNSNYASQEGYSFVFFPDVAIGEWFAQYVAYAKDYDIVGGYVDGTFGPGNFITRAEVAKIVTKILDMQ